MEQKLNEILNEINNLRDRPNVRHIQSQENLREESEQYGVRTSWGNVVFHTMVKHRIAPLTVYVGGSEVIEKELSEKQKGILVRLPDTLESVHKYMKKAPFVCVEREMGINCEFTPHCTLFVSTQLKEMVRVAYMWATLLPLPKEPTEPVLNMVIIPEWLEEDRQALVFPEIGVTYALGTNYVGECKKGFLRMAMWHVKQRGMLGLHAGSKLIKARDAQSGKLRRYSCLIFGLTATGKTTHTCHDHGLDGEQEGIEIAQDDVGFLKPDGSVLGPEIAFYLKTEGLSPNIQPLLYKAATKRETILENVMVGYQGNVDFDDTTLTGNGREIVPRENFPDKYLTKGLNLPPINELDGLLIFFITRRNTVVPIVSKLGLKQGAAAFMLGESIESSGGDPTRAGESIRVVGTNPFIIGDRVEEGNRFYEFIKSSGNVQCYLLNTGGIGEIVENQGGTKVLKQKVTRVEIPEMASIIRGIARGTIRWADEPYFGTKIPTRVDGVNLSKFDLNKYYTQDQINSYVNKLKEERRDWLKQFDNLDPDIIKAFD